MLSAVTMYYNYMYINNTIYSTLVSYCMYNVYKSSVIFLTVHMSVAVYFYSPL